MIFTASSSPYSADFQPCFQNYILQLFAPMTSWCQGADITIGCLLLQNVYSSSISSLRPIVLMAKGVPSVTMVLSRGTRGWLLFVINLRHLLDSWDNFSIRKKRPRNEWFSTPVDESYAITKSSSSFSWKVPRDIDDEGPCPKIINIGRVSLLWNLRALNWPYCFVEHRFRKTGRLQMELEQRSR